MRKGIFIALMALFVSGCAAMPERDRNTIMGSLAGAGVGAVVGHAVGGPATGWLGAAVGSAAGGIIGYLIRPDGCFVQNSRGELWQVPCDDLPVRTAGCYIGNDIRGLHEVDCPSRWGRRLGRLKVAKSAAAE